MCCNGRGNKCDFNFADDERCLVPSEIYKLCIVCGANVYGLDVSCDFYRFVVCFMIVLNFIAEIDTEEINKSKN